MDASLGKIRAHLAGPAIGRIEELVGLINDNIKPPGPVSEQDVYIRAMYIVSDEVNSFGGRFPAEELSRLTELLVDSPVMVGHRKDRLPVARTFHARLVDRDGKEWIKSYFYWLRSARGAQDLKENIDGGIYKECSIGFTYTFPECCLCGKDIRTCRHEPLENYVVDGESRTCHFNYRKVQRVLETSLVYRGAVADTGMSRDLVNEPLADQGGHEGDRAGLDSPLSLTSPAELPLDKTYLVVPNYESLPVVLTSDNGRTRIIGVDDSVIPPEVVDRLCGDEMLWPDNACGLLIGYRGKERCSADQLRKYLAGNRSGVKRVELKLFPYGDIEAHPGSGEDRRAAVSMIRYEYGGAAELPSIARRLMTRDGVRLWSDDRPFPEHAGYIYRPEQDDDRCVGYYRISLEQGNGDALLELCHEQQIARYWLRQFHPARFAKGCRFIGDAAEDNDAHNKGVGGKVVAGEIACLEHRDDGLILRLEGGLAANVGIQPIKINGRSRVMIYRLAAADVWPGRGCDDGR